MVQVNLTIWSGGQSQIIPLTHSRFSIGRGDQADIKLDDQGLSRLHASIHRAGDKVWVADEGSTNGSFVNGQRVPAGGMPLTDGDRITLGDETKITVTIVRTQTASAPTSTRENSSSAFPLIPFVTAVALIVGVVIFVAAYAWRRPPPPPVDVVTTLSPSVSVTPSPVPTATPTESEIIDPSVLKTAVVVEQSPLEIATNTGNLKITPRTKKLYQQMGEPERITYISEKVQEVAIMIGNRPAVFPDEAITIIKTWLDAYAKRVGNGRSGLWGGDLNRIFERAKTRYTPTIIAAFKAHKSPVVVGVYLPFIETEYNNIQSNNRAGAAGLFQFLGPTARGYGVDPSERTNIEKMAPAAARYINDRMKNFGADAVGVGLSIAGYNRSPASVKRDLHKIINSKNKERDFWILVRNSAQLDHWFQDENINYVPRFFAAAIIGENPWDFGVALDRKLSTYTEVKITADEMNKPQ